MKKKISLLFAIVMLLSGCNSNTTQETTVLTKDTAVVMDETKAEETSATETLAVETTSDAEIVEKPVMFDETIIKEYFLGIWESEDDKFAIGKRKKKNIVDFFNNYGLIKETYVTDKVAVVVCENFISESYRIEIELYNPDVILFYDETEEKGNDKYIPRQFTRTGNVGMYTDTGEVNGYIMSLLYCKYGYTEPSISIDKYSNDSEYFNDGSSISFLKSHNEDKLEFVSLFVDSSDTEAKEAVYIEYEKIKSDGDWETGEWNVIDNRFAFHLTDYTLRNENPPYGVLVEDINDDGQDEMVMQINPYGFLDVLYMKNGELKVVSCDVMSMWGNTWYDKEKKRIINESFYGHTEGTAGSYDFHIFDWNGEDYVETMHLVRDSGHYEYEDDGLTRTDNFVYGQSYLNSEEISNEQFEEYFAEFEADMKDENLFDVVTSGQFEEDKEVAKEKLDIYNAYIDEKLYQ